MRVARFTLSLISDQRRRLDNQDDEARRETAPLYKYLIIRVLRCDSCRRHAHSGCGRAVIFRFPPHSNAYNLWRSSCSCAADASTWISI